MPSDAVAQRLARLADDLELALRDSAVVERADLRRGQAGAVQASIAPRRAGALRVAWLDFGNALRVAGGHNGGRLELDRVEVTRADGTVVHETGVRGVVYE